VPSPTVGNHAQWHNIRLIARRGRLREHKSRGGAAWRTEQRSKIGRLFIDCFSDRFSGKTQLYNCCTLRIDYIDIDRCDIV